MCRGLLADGVKSFLSSMDTLLGVISGGIFDSPLLAMLGATVLVLAVGAVTNLVGSRRRAVPVVPEPEHCESS